MVIIVLAVIFYIGLNFMSTPPPTSLTTMFGETRRVYEDTISLVKMVCRINLFQHFLNSPIEPISDLGIDKINVLMFDDAK
ncbi:hypothetical protein E1A91_A08G174000v1 [Gossypium mustelinum]|uniref:Uncharacterized protein n=1 Tax=Gossypium mustelinum TaxID=34275 RepID=A0A5D2Y9V4_GOSMU|nr:hypothetical protein E1A91_A08G174000v1 [Gossypium mustelinum]